MQAEAAQHLLATGLRQILTNVLQSLEFIPASKLILCTQPFETAITTYHHVSCAPHQHIGHRYLSLTFLLI